MTIKSHIAAQKRQAEKPKAGAKSKAEEPKDDEKDEEKMEGEEETKPDDDKAKSKGKAKAEDEKDEEKMEGEEDDEKMEGEEEDEETLSAAPADTVAADPGTVAQLCADAAVPNMAKSLIDAKLPLSEVKARINSAGAIRGACAAAARISRTVDPKLADAFIKNGASVEHVKAELFDMVIGAEGPEIRNSHTSGARPAGVVAESHGWDAAIAKNAKRRGLA